MAKKGVHKSIVEAVEKGRLREPFTSNDFRRACPCFADGTYKTFLHKHSVGNPGGNSELYKRIAPGLFELVRPIRYNL